MELNDGGLAAIANSIAELLGAPVTIEDPDTIVMAYSGGEQAVDEARIGTILSRQVPLKFRTALAAAGVFDRLRATDDVVYVDLPAASMMPRAVIAVRQNGMLLGSIWAAVQQIPTAEQEAVLHYAAPIVGRLIGEERERSDASSRERRGLMLRLLAGGTRAVEAARELGLQAPLVVAAISGPGEVIESGLARSVAIHLGAMAPRSITAHLDDTTYSVVGADLERTQKILTGFLARSRQGRQLTIGLGQQIDDPQNINASRSDADLALSALLATGSLGTVATLRERLADVIALQTAGFLNTHHELSPLTALRSYDRTHDTRLVEAAAAFLTAGGDYASAAKAIHVHPNTMRNRLKRAAKSCAVDLANPDTRLVLMLHLKVAELESADRPS